MSHQHATPDRLRPIVEGLGWGGILPFLMLPLVSIIALPAQLTPLLIAYCLLILSFLCGTLWMEAILGHRATTWRVLASNLILLGAWPAILLPLPGAASLLALGFAVHLWLDAPWQQTIHAPWYRRLRLRLSSLATALLVITALLGAFL